jgi:integrase
VKRPEIDPLTLEQAKRFLEAARGERLEALYATVLMLGLRRGEILGLRWEDIDLDARTLRVAQALQRADGRLRIVEPKSDRSRRVLALPESVVASLRGHRVRQLEERLAAGSGWQNTGLVFASIAGKPLDPQNMSRHFRRLLRKAGLKMFRFHDLRHSAASFLLAQGAHPRAIMELLGHSQSSLTMNTYSHVMPAMMRDLADKMDSLIAVGN